MNPTPEELKNKFSPVKEDRKGLRDSWEQSGGKKRPLEKIWEWAKT